MDHTITPELTAAFSRRAAALGYEIRQIPQAEDEKLLLTAYRSGNEVCKFETGGAMRFMQDNPLIAERKELHSLLLDMKQAHDLYADAAPLKLAGVSDFRMISEFGDVLLAAKMSKDHEIRFTTWEYTYDRAGVTWGHYYETNYEGAKRDFAIRAGLIDENQLFTKEELVALHDACVFRGRNDDEISYEDDKKLQAVMEKVEENIPDLIFDREQPEQEDSRGIQPD